MSIYLDRQETQATKSREAALFRDLKGVLSVAKGRAASLREQLHGIDLRNLRTRADLASIPVVRNLDLWKAPKEQPLCGGFFAPRNGALRVVIESPGHGIVPEGQSKDWWRAARAMNAAGFRNCDFVLNDFNYHRGALARMAESGANALGCAVFPIHEQKPAAVMACLDRMSSPAYCGPVDRLVEFASSYKGRSNGRGALKTALCFEEIPTATRSELNACGIRAFRSYATDELGVIAYEASPEENATEEELIVNEGVIVEIVKPGTGDPLPFGSLGEIVVTRLNLDFPLLRHATGDWGSLVPGPSPCGRTNMRLRKIQKGATVCLPQSATKAR